MGEIEAALRQCAGVREAVVVARGPGGETRLAGYVGAAEGVTASALRQQLQASLPDYMVPAALVVMEKLPLSEHGKVDRKALPEPEGVRGKAEYEAPRNAVEAELAQIWGEVLGLERVGIRENFFELGGDSIRSIQVRARAGEAGLEFSVQDRSGTPRWRVGGSGAGVRGRAGSGGSGIQPDRGGGSGAAAERRGGCLPAGAAAGGHAVPQRVQSGLGGVSRCLQFHLQRPFDAGRLQGAIDAVVGRHAMLRTSFELSAASEPLQLVWREARVKLGVSDLRGLEEAEQERALEQWMEAEKAKRFDWRRRRCALPRAPAQRGEFSVHADRAPRDSGRVECGQPADGLLQHHLLSGSGGNGAGGALPRGMWRGSGERWGRRRAGSIGSRCWWGARMTQLPRRESAAGREGARAGIWKRTFRQRWRGPEGGGGAGRGAGEERAVGGASAGLGLVSGQRRNNHGVVTNGRREERGGEAGCWGCLKNTVPLRSRIGGRQLAGVGRETFAAEVRDAGAPLVSAAELQKGSGAVRGRVQLHIISRCVRGIAGGGRTERGGAGGTKRATSP